MKPSTCCTLTALLLVNIPSTAAEPDGNAEVAKLLCKFVNEKLPKPFAFEDMSGWGKTVPDPGNLRATRLRRTWVQVGDRMELPNGIWTRTKIVIADPKQDIDIRIPAFRKMDDKKLDLQIEATVRLVGEREWKTWRYGIGLLPGITVQADVVVVITADCDVGVNVLKGKFPPEVEIAPAVRQVRLDIKEFAVRRIGPVALLGDTSKSVSDDLRGFIEGMVKAKEMEAKDFANKAIAETLKDGKAKLSVTDLLKLQNGK